MKKLAVLIAAAIVLAGCQRTQWVRANTTAQQFNADKYQCEIEARRMYPSTAGQPIGNPTYSTNCYGSGNNLNCTSQQNQQMRSWYDTNAYPRARMEEQCLKARGYYQQVVDENRSGNSGANIAGGGHRTTSDVKSKYGNSIPQTVAERDGCANPYPMTGKSSEMLFVFQCDDKSTFTVVCDSERWNRNCKTVKQNANINHTPQSHKLNRCKISDGSYRKLTPSECEQIGGSVISFD